MPIKEKSALKTSNEITNIQSTQKIEDKPKKDNLQPTIENSKIEKEKASKYPKAPDFAGIERWINSEPLSMEQLKGKVVLVDFWTYTCINCIRTLPYLKEWDEKYKEKGLVIVGVHTPEFEFEKKYENVLDAVGQYQLKYPVAQDNLYATWSAYKNRYWPREFLIDIDGYIRHDHIGEGSYDETEKIIQELLKERMERINKNDTINASITANNQTYFRPLEIGTPEIYFGYKFSRGNFGNSQGLKPEQIVDYKTPSSITENNAYLSGKWKNNADNMELAQDVGDITLKFSAKVVNIVAGSQNSSQALVHLDDIFINNESTIKEFKLYNVVNSQNYGTHTVNIKIKGKGFKIFTFTFG